ncbi:hypothetical protein BJF89_17680 [Corynebacterium sp. CNJ-954]|uniref:tautomerase family protein n=1 Tax=Corynebacterium sp. CNJ-954 TaxID=1904962 RepID=UPI0009665010|nr:tautomerase family protein [Corynebacterium sp. CNJ-954]OLT53284.1 hypothetical protein BJF89_17680 [Corynebacterium sp. CNJ-954]
MPIIHITAPAGTFNNHTRDELAEQLTTIALTHEGLPLTAFVRSTVWIYMHDLTPTHVYHGGQTARASVTTVEVNAFAGGLDDMAKEHIISDFTHAIKHAANMPDDAPAPVYILFRDIQPTNGGVFGSTISLDELRHPDPDARPI